MALDQGLDWHGRKVLDPEGEKIGSVEEVYLDEQTGKPEWLLVKTGMFGSSSTLVPIQGAQSTSDDEVRVSFDKAQVKDAPNIDAGHELSQAEEAEIYSHYGISYGEQRSDSGLPESGAATTDSGGRDQATVGRDVSGPETDDAMTRSEEELRVGTEKRESGRVRLRKYVVTENVTTTVPVSREEVRLEREPITDKNAGNATSGPDLSEEEHEVTLHEERPVIDKDVVPKERVRLSKDQITDEQQISEEVRKEQIETEGDVTGR